jgi:hypothetical protein
MCDKKTKIKINSFIMGGCNSIVLCLLVKNKGEDELTDEVACLDLEDKSVILSDKAVYFVRSGAEELTSENFDNLVTWGELNQFTADTLKNLMHHCMLPFLKGSSGNTKSWGLCEEHQKEEYLHSFRRFNNDLIESIKNSKTEIMLKIKPRLAEFFAGNSMEFLKLQVSDVLNDKSNGGGLATLNKITNQKNN